MTREDNDSNAPPPVSLLNLLRTPSPTANKAIPVPILRRDSLSSEADIDWSHKIDRKSLTFAVKVHDNVFHPPLRLPSPLIDSDDSDGYQEDEEEGIGSDDEVFGVFFPAIKQTSPFNAYAIHQPGRKDGHIHVVDTKQKSKRCSRHRSPPPLRSRSGSETRSRTSDAGPRQGRCGSPMPNVSDLPIEDDSPPPRARRASDHLHGYKRTNPCPPSVNRAEVNGSMSGEEGVYQRLESSLATTLTRARTMKV